jgi:hypothetical protein
MKTRVYITVDVEASVARSIHRYADGFRPLLDSFVACDVGGRSEGLGFLLRTLSRHDQTATFFVEAAQTQYFGVEPMGRYVEELLGAGQDVQLHVHPAWFNFRDGPPSADPAKRLSDECADYTEAELTDLFGQCVEIFRGWTGRAPSALRTGTFSCSRSVFRAMANCGIPLSSNICVGISEPKEPEYRRPCGWMRAEGVWESPATCFLDRHPGRPPGFRPLQITACSASELTAMLDQAQALGMTDVVLLTHPFEFVRVSSRDSHTPESTKRMLINRTIQKRFEEVCAYLADNTERFEVKTFGDWSAHGDIGAAGFAVRDYPALQGSAVQAVLRSVSNTISDRLPW